MKSLIISLVLLLPSISFALTPMTTICDQWGCRQVIVFDDLDASDGESAPDLVVVSPY